MTPGQIFDSSLVILRARGLRIILKSLFPAVVIFVAYGFLKDFTLPVLGYINEELWMDVAVIAVGLLVCVPVILVAFSYIMYETISETAGFIMGDDQIQVSAEIGEKISLIFGLVVHMAPALLVFAVLGAGFVTGSSLLQRYTSMDDFFMVLIFMLSLALLLAIPYTMTKVSMAIGAAIVERVPVKEAIRRANELYRTKAPGVNNFPTAITLWFLAWLFGTLFMVFVWGVISLISDAFVPFELAGFSVIDLALGAIGFAPAIALQVALLSIMLIVLYFERRVRFEAFDVYQLAEDMRNASREKIRVR